MHGYVIDPTILIGKGKGGSVYIRRISPNSPDLPFDFKGSYSCYSCDSVWHGFDKSLVCFRRNLVPDGLSTGHTIPLNYGPVVYGHVTGVPDVFLGLRSDEFRGQ